MRKRDLKKRLEELGDATWNLEQLERRINDLQRRMHRIEKGLHRRHVMDYPMTVYRDPHEISLPYLKAAVDALLTRADLVCEFVEARFQVSEVESEEGEG